MNKEQIIDVAYENYNKEIIRQREIQKEEVNRLRSQGKRVRVSLIELLTKEDFINRCKTDTEFSEKWGLKIEERELSREERIDLYAKEYTPGMRNKYEKPFDDFIDDKLKTRNIPTKLITLTYNNETLKSYE
jgi:hypothetical protein